MVRFKIINIALIIFSSSLSSAAAETLLSSISALNDSPVTRVNSALQNYNRHSNMFGEASPPQIQEDGSIIYYFRSGLGSVIQGTCTEDGCNSTSEVSCGDNMQAKLDGTCECKEGHKQAKRMDWASAGRPHCIEEQTCAPGTFLLGGHFASEERCQCENNIRETIALGAPNTCTTNIDTENSCPPDPSIDDPFVTEAVMEDWRNTCQQARQAEIEAQRLQNQQAARSNATEQAESELQAAIEAEAQRLAQECRGAVASFKSSCSSVRPIPQANTNFNNASTKERCESLSATAKSGIESVQSDVNTCITKYNSLAGSCPSNTETLTGTGESTVSDGSETYGDAVVVTETDSKTGSGPVPGVGAMVGEASSINSNLINQGSEIETELAKLDESSRQCIVALEEDPDSTNANNYLNMAQGFAGTATSLGSSRGYSNSYSGTELGKGGGGSNFSSHDAYNTGRTIRDTIDRALDLGGNGSVGNPYGGADDGVYGSGPTDNFNPNGGTPGQNFNNGGQRLGALAGKTNAQFARGGAAGNSAPGARKNNRRGFRSAKARNLVNGYRNIKASDGGSNISIKPGDFKRYGSKTLRAKLAEARSRHGKDLPLIFKNGKFVLDFLAMKESSQFKARTAAMESYMKGGQRRTASANRELNVHQDPGLNIFKIMNFRYQRQDFDEATSL